jgi:O-antigen/teichoic acid export membrane protein
VSPDQEQLSSTEQRKPTLRADFSWTLVGNAVYAAGQFATLMLLAKLLRPELVGQYALGLAIVYPVINLANLQLRALITSRTRQEIDFGHYLGLRLLTTSLGLMFISAITQILRYDRELTTVVLMVGVAYALESISDVYYARLQLHDRMPQVAKSLIIRATLSVLALGVATYFSRKLLWGIAGIVLGRAMVILAYDIRNRTHGLRKPLGWSFRHEALRPRFDVRVHREILRLSLPLGVVVLLAAFNSSIPSYFIKHALGERDLGLFSAIGFMVSVGNMAVTSLGQAAFTRLARSYAAGNFAGFGSLLAKLVVFGAAIGAGGIALSKLAGQEILTILFRPEYAERANLLPWMMAAGGVLFMAQFVGFGLTAANFYHSQVVLNMVSVLSLLAGCYWLTPRSGLLGSILAMLIAAIVQLFTSIIILLIGMRKQRSIAGVESPGTKTAIARERTPAFDGAH